ncbi:protein moxZ [Paracoccus sp. 22332]|uniref:protein moxZ n=1 Tax=Paracoccus sp. 22332 TaxID=3453913 RepID=UPI003F85463E
MQVTATRYRTAAMTALMALALSACREEEPTLPAASEQVHRMPAEGQAWLDATGDEAPSAFLARVTGHPAYGIAPSLDRATAAYGDSPRMIANRAAQLWDEIRRKDDPPIAVAALLDQLAAGGGPDRPSIGPVIQHYRVLRAQGADHAAAMRAATAEGRVP